MLVGRRQRNRRPLVRGERSAGSSICPLLGALANVCSQASSTSGRDARTDNGGADVHAAVAVNVHAYDHAYDHDHDHDHALLVLDPDAVAQIPPPARRPSLPTVRS